VVHQNLGIFSSPSSFPILVQAGKRTIFSFRARNGVPQYWALPLYEGWFSKNSRSASRATLIFLFVSISSVLGSLRNVTQSQRNDPSGQNVNDVSSGILFRNVRPVDKAGVGQMTHMRSILVKTPIVLVPSGRLLSPTSTRPSSPGLVTGVTPE